MRRKTSKSATPAADGGQEQPVQSDAMAPAGFGRVPDPDPPRDPDPDIQVAVWLRDHPDFFARHPDLLAVLDIPHDCAPAASLIERQVQVLRQQLATEHQRLVHLIARAREYETLAARLHTLVLQLIASQTPDQVLNVLHDSLRREFRAEAVALRLFQLAPDAEHPGDPLTLAFRDFLDGTQALCGPLDAERARLLFGDAAGPIQTAALIPLRAGGQSGVLAIGSADAERFHPEMGTELLDRLGDVVSQKLRVMPLPDAPEPRDTAA